MNQIPTIVVNKKTGQRYVKVGSKRVKVDAKISERELLKWILNTFVKRKKRKANSKPKVIKDQEVKSNVINHNSTVASDKDRNEARQVKLLLDEKVKELDRLKMAQQIASNLQQPADMMRVADVKRLAENAREAVQQALDHKDQQIEEVKDEVNDANEQLMAKHKKELDDTINDLNRDLEARLADNRKDVLNNVKRLRAIARMHNAKGGPQIIGVLDESEPRDKMKKKELLDHPMMVEYLTHDVLDKQSYADDVKVQEVAAKLEAAMNERDALVGQGRDLEKSTGTSEDQLNKAMKSYPEYLGTIASDEIPTHTSTLKFLQADGRLPKKFCWVMNTEPRSQPGAHWVCFYVDLPRELNYYDSLADPINPKVLKDVKSMIQSVYGDKTYLRFKENSIPDQSDTSNNCGEFCVHFLQSRLKGETFGKATGWNDLGEKKIEQWKLRPKQKVWLSGQTGEGIRDITIAPRKGASRIIDRIKATEELLKKIEK